MIYLLILIIIYIVQINIVQNKFKKDMFWVNQTSLRFFNFKTRGEYLRAFIPFLWILKVPQFSYKEIIKPFIKAILSLPKECMYILEDKKNNRAIHWDKLKKKNESIGN